eukprot:gene2596-3008_t
MSLIQSASDLPWPPTVETLLSEEHQPPENLTNCLTPRLGHCCNYNKVQEIETAQAELTERMISLQHPLPLIPVDAAGKAPTIFWWDNFDCKTETKEGSIHTCNRDETLEVPVSKKRTVSVEVQELKKVKVIPHKEPPPFDSILPIPT